MPATRCVIHHPAFQSLLLPLLLALPAIAAVRAAIGPRHAAWGGWLALLGALAWLPGFEWPAGARTQKLPWIVLATLGLAALDLMRRGPGTQPLSGGRAAALGWVAAAMGWAAAATWLADGRVGFAAAAAAAVFGAAVLAALALGSDEGDSPRSVTTAVLAWAALGLAGVSALGGSLLLAQLAAMLAVSVAAAGAPGWVRPAWRLAVSPSLRMAFALAWLALAWTWVLSTRAGLPGATVDAASAGQVGMLALTFLVPVGVAWRQRASQRVSAPGSASTSPPAGMLAGVFAVVLAVVPVVLALAWTASAGSGVMTDPAADPDDPYLTSTAPAHGTQARPAGWVAGR